MKKTKILTLLGVTSMALALSSGAAMAQHHEDMGHDGPHKGAKMFEKMDTDGDGVITKAEFVTASEKRFEKMDTDGDGNITEDEVKAAGDKWKEKMQEHHDMKDKEAE